MMDYIVVQAGGKGSRLGHLTANKPKALVPVENLPMLFHLFKKFPDKKFIIIADYHKEVLRSYLESFASVEYQIVDAEGTGTCSGVKQAINLIPNNKVFMLIWSDLILPNDFVLPTDSSNYIGISQTFPCRWSYQDEEFVEEPSEKYGVAGMFVFQNKAILEKVPQSGELVRWISQQGIEFKTAGLAGTREFGILAEYEKLAVEKSRPFNKIIFDEETVTKESVDKQGDLLAKRERNWYEFAMSQGINALPKVYSLEPLKIERIKGKNIYECEALSREEKEKILEKLVNALNELHALKTFETDTFSVRDAYYSKTIDRIQKVRDLIPFADQKTITINGKKCRNIFFYKREFERLLDNIKCEDFSFLHGDCTFSNLMLRESGEPVFIDPRGYFGFTELYGDSNYDWAKLFYSIVGNYDQFNLKRFTMSLSENAVDLTIKSNNWEDLEEKFFELTGVDKQTIKLLHAVIWLSLTTYAWQDYDSVCGSFYNGLYYLEEVWS